MGEVVEAWDTLLGRKVALKSLTAPYAAAILRFMREAQLQARVTHPNVCRIYDVDASGEVPFIAMQLVQGPTLLQAAQELSVDAAVEILHSVALAINAAHRLNLIHRDIKPSNILLEPDGMGGWNTYVADFGLAKDLGAEVPSQTHVPMGTPEYMPPEQQRGDTGAMGPAVDVYSLGATLRAVLELGRGGARAFLGDSQSSATWRALPRKLRIIIARCMEERPQDRYRSAGELADDLRRFLDGEPLLAQRGSWHRELRRNIRRHPALVASMAVFLVLGAGFAAWSVRLAARGQRQAALAQRFALDARDLENRMRIERLIPVHDLRPAMAHMLGRLDRIRRDMAALGPEAQGPGNLALGRGYGALGELDRALAALEMAWRGGYATPEVAYALSKVHSDYCLRLDDGELAVAPGASHDALWSTHLGNARAFFNLAQGATWEPMELGEAGLLNQEGAYAASLAKARKAFKEAPWLYEAKVEEARALTGLGLERLARRQEQAALSLFREAGLAAQVAQDIGHSDETCYLVDLDWRLHRLERPGQAPAAILAGLEEAEPLADKALAIRPDSPAAFSAKIHLVLRRASAMAEAGRDPEPELRRAERYLAPSAEHPAMEQLVYRSRRWSQCIRAEFRMARGAGPGTELDWALEEEGGGIWNLEALILKARWQARHRRDPGPALQVFWSHQGIALNRNELPRKQVLQAQARQLGAGWTWR
jgi:serine/threonine-protein kinase